MWIIQHILVDILEAITSLAINVRHDGHLTGRQINFRWALWEG